jgi:biotin carboxylase
VIAKTLMVIGAGFGQLPAILSARDMGLKVVALDWNSDALGMKEADVPLVVDVKDHDGAIRAAREHGVDGVMTMQSDLPVPTVGAVVDALGLPGVGLEVGARCSNKIEARQRFAEAGVPQPPFGVAEDLKTAEIVAREVGFPCVIKAPDSSGSRGVTRVNGPADVSAAFTEARRWARDDRILIEGFVEGIEIGAQGFSVDGRCVRVWVHDDMVSSPPYMIPTGHAYPTSLGPTTLTAAEEACARAVDALGIPTGPTNIDLILGTDGVPMIIEIGARIGATCLPELTTYFTGIDWVAASIRAALGETPDLAPTAARPVAAYILEAPADGILKGWTFPEELRNAPGLVEWEVSAAIGEEVNLFRKGTDRIGKIVAAGETLDEAMARAKRFREAFVFDVEAI